MAISQDVVRRLTVVATERGLTSLKQNLRETDRAFDQVGASATRAATATEAADRRMMALLRQRDRLATAMNAGGLGGVGRTAANDLGNAAAFATSRLIPLVAAAGTAVVAYKALNAVWDRGTELLEEYGNAQRKLVANVDENLKALTRFQDAGLTAEQVQRATELGARLIEAKRTIEEFSAVQFNLTDPALKLQAVWVGIVESIASAVEWANKLQKSQPVVAVQDFVQRNFVQGQQAPSWILGPEEATQGVDRAKALEAAYERLRGGMGSTSNFAVRFGNAVNDLKNPIKEVAKEAEKAAEAAKGLAAYGNALQRLRDQNEVLEEQIKWLGKTTEEVDRLRAARELERAAAKAGRDLTPELRAEIDAEAATYARLREELRNVNEQRRMVESLGSAIVSAFTGGGDAVQKLTSSLAGLATQLASKNLSNFLNGGSIFGNQKLMSAGGAAGMLGAGAMGYQSGSPLMGALGGAMAGATFGPIGMLAGGAIGGIAGLFGGNAQKKQQQQAMQAQAAAINQQTQLLGVDTSTLAGAKQALTIQQQGDMQAAAIEKNWAKVSALQNLHNAQQLQLEKEWNEREAEVAKQQREEELRLAEEHAKAVLQRNQANADRAFLAGLDTSTEQGALMAAERAFQREREAEIEAGGEALISLELAHAIELQNIRDQFHKQEVEKTKQAQEQILASIRNSAKQITDYLLGLRTGVESPLAPSARYGAASSAFGSTLGLAQGSNADALDRITKDADAFLQASKAMFGSGAQFQADFAMVQQKLTALPAIQQSEDPVVQALNQISRRQEDIYFGDIAAATDSTSDRQSNTNSLLSAIFGTLNGFPSYYTQMISALGAVASSTAAAAAAQQAALQAEADAAAAELAKKQKAYDTAYQTYLFNVGPHGGYSSIPGANNYMPPPNPAAYGLQQGGLVPGYADGGVIGNGVWNKDSVLARYAGGGNIALAGGEFVMPAPQTQRFMPQLEAMRSGSANDNSSAEVRALRRDMAMMLTQLTKVAAQIPVAVHEGFREQNRVIKSEERTQSDDKKARRRGRAA